MEKVSEGYNAGVNSSTANKLLALNREFYERFGDSFSATRRRLQPGVKKTLGLIRGEESVLDLGCGNGWFLLELGLGGHPAPLLGVDFSPPLLRDAGSQPGGGSVRFLEIDLTQLPAHGDSLSIPGGWDVITMFAALHHIPLQAVRLEIVHTVGKLLNRDGRFILSNWQFLNSERLRSRIQPWTRIGLSDADVDEGDYLLDWRSGGEGLRYVHHFSAEELSALAVQAGLRVIDSFSSDGGNGRLALYQIWTRA
jgi:SAM-dependent methyltransferase